jgi:tRNA-dihydrouridine synthase
MSARGRFLLDYIDLLLTERIDDARRQSHDRWVVNKLRALGSWYTKGLDNGSHLRTAINSVESVAGLREMIEAFFGGDGRAVPAECSTVSFSTQLSSS